MKDHGWANVFDNKLDCGEIGVRFARVVIMGLLSTANFPRLAI